MAGSKSEAEEVKVDPVAEQTSLKKPDEQASNQEKHDGSLESEDESPVEKQPIKKPHAAHKFVKCKFLSFLIVTVI
jgi:hypothetical protein